jgi:hypothetical protein
VLGRLIEELLKAWQARGAEHRRCNARYRKDSTHRHIARLLGLVLLPHAERVFHDGWRHGEGAGEVIGNATKFLLVKLAAQFLRTAQGAARLAHIAGIWRDRDKL